ncbi:MAG: tetratricopeptide repeat protein [Sphingobacteriia bacterium]
MVLLILLYYLLAARLRQEEAMRTRYARQLFLSARYYLEHSQFLLAIRRYDRLIALYPDNPTYYLERGLAYVRSQQPEAALADLKHIDGSQIEDTSFHQLMGLLFLKLADYPAARLAADRALRADPHNPEALFTLALSALYNGDAEEAIERFAQLTEDYPERAIYWNHLGMALYAHNRAEESLEAFNDGVERADDPEERSTILSNRAEVLLTLGAAPQALDDSNRAISHNERNAMAHWQRSSLLLMQGRWAEAFAQAEVACVLEYEADWLAYVYPN